MERSSGLAPCGWVEAPAESPMKPLVRVKSQLWWKTQDVEEAKIMEYLPKTVGPVNLQDKLYVLWMAEPDEWTAQPFEVLKTMSEPQILDIQLQDLDFHGWILGLLVSNCFNGPFLSLWNKKV